MNDYDEQDELGRNVTHLLKGDGRTATAIIPVSLEYEDLVFLEKIGRENGKTVAQVIRDAISAYRIKQPATQSQR